MAARFLACGDYRRGVRHDSNRIRQIPLTEANKLVTILGNREFDRSARDFLARNPEAVVAHTGRGLDSRFERVDDGRVEWYDLDLPDVIELRRKFLGGEGGAIICWAVRCSTTLGWTR